jgi:cell division protein ZapA (FtsZ GTPase activity inhibitor)
MNLAETIIPKSDQLNADDLILGPITIKVTEIKEAERNGFKAFDVYYEGDNGKPYKPCKGMRRVIVSSWGKDGTAYIGRSMTLYCDDTVLFGGIAVGGIRISHLSHIEKDLTLALTVSRASRKPYTVKRLDVATPVTDVAALAAIDAANTLDELVNLWKSLTKEEQKMPTVIAAKDAKKVELTPKTETE